MQNKEVSNMLEMKKRATAKLGALVTTMAAFATLLGIVQATQPGSTSSAQAEQAVASVQSSTGTSAVQSPTAEPTAAAHTTTHVS